MEATLCGIGGCTIVACLGGGAAGVVGSTIGILGSWAVIGGLAEGVATNRGGAEVVDLVGDVSAEESSGELA